MRIFPGASRENTHLWLLPEVDKPCNVFLLITKLYVMCTGCVPMSNLGVKSPKMPYVREVLVRIPDIILMIITSISLLQGSGVINTVCPPGACSDIDMEVRKPILMTINLSRPPRTSTNE